MRSHLDPEGEAAGPRPVKTAPRLRLPRQRHRPIATRGYAGLLANKSYFNLLPAAWPGVVL